MSDPWIAYGQTGIVSGGVKLNPPTNMSNGLLGEVSLPYTVPVGKVLVLKKIEFEPLWGMALIPYFGDSTSTTEMTPPTLAGNTYSSGSSPSTAPAANMRSASFDCEYHVPAGLKVNVRIAAGYNPGPGEAWLYGWAMTGELRDA
ncbi:hypothetical protein [Tardiphaga sp. 709]|uniref:hypothetical protein n=1 Tax=Tardiphaga sp. 709 TaxID=3076039 RepID=UPI0028EFCB7C|nr:hypothetical protein [Tardiphaga sp. 709]WNV09945.1 hypothetical protein RSO67_01750 [Tardiphaga sp. 709]